MGVGDINSDKRGSGARFNDEKPAYELIPIRYMIMALSDYFDENLAYGTQEYQAWKMLESMKSFQETGDISYIKAAMKQTYGGISCKYSIASFETAANVFSYGKEKYAPWNWAKGMKWSICIGCILRHIESILAGDYIDSESGLHHMGHIQCNLFMLMHYFYSFEEGNDLPSPAYFSNCRAQNRSD